MNRRVLMPALLTAALLAPAALRAQEQGYPFRWSNFRIEISGGWIGLQPRDLDKAVEYENAYIDHYFVERYDYYDLLYGEDYAARLAFTGGQEFLPLRSALPLSAAIRYQASPTLGLSLGLQLLRGSQTSAVGLDVAVTDTRADSPLPGASTASYANDGLTVSVDAWMPFLAANFGWDLLKPLRGEIFFLGGPIFGDLRVWNSSRESLSSAAGTIAAGTRTIELTGSQTSMAVELGGRLELKVSGFLHLYGQAGYAFRAFNNLHGLNSILQTSEFPTASETRYALEGPWGVNREEVDTPWGRFEAPILTTEFGTYFWKNDIQAFGTAPAEVNLSGLQLQAGLSIRL